MGSPKEFMVARKPRQQGLNFCEATGHLNLELNLLTNVRKINDSSWPYLLSSFFKSIIFLGWGHHIISFFLEEPMQWI